MRLVRITLAGLLRAALGWPLLGIGVLFNTAGAHVATLASWIEGDAHA